MPLIEKENCQIGLWCEENTTTAPVAAIKKFIEVRDKAIAENPDNELVSEEKRDDFIDALTEYLDEATRPEAQLNFHELTKLLLLDEGAQAEHILAEGLKIGPEHGRSAAVNRNKELTRLHKKMMRQRVQNLRRDISGIRQQPDLYLCLSPFLLGQVEKLNKEVETKLETAQPGSVWQEIFKTIDAHCSKVNSHGQREFLTPSLRFLVGMLLNLHVDPFEVFKDAGTPEWTKGDFPIRLLKDLKPAQFKSRKSILADHLDPIRKLALDLNIQRFLTTNYDFEIERFFQDIGFSREVETEDRTAHQINQSPPPMRPDAPRSGQLGQVMRDMTFRREKASDLFRFAAGADGSDVSVYHLHGRATDTGDIVVTERDYMELYLREDSDREIVDEGIRLAFSANPVLFLGLGMTEADILRPLRQFMSNHDRAIPHRSIVLMPAEKDHDARAKTSSGLYLRYGTHTIFYGDGIVRAEHLPADAKPLKLDWMHRILKLIEALTEINATVRKDLVQQVKPENGYNTPVWTGTPALKQIRDKLGTVEHEGATYDVLGLLLGVAVPGAEDLGDPKDWKIKPCIFQIGPHYDARREEAETNAARYLNPVLELLTLALRMTVTDELTSNGKKPKGPDANALPTHIRDLRARQTLLDGLWGAVLTGCFNAALDGLKDGWRIWWEQWQQSPPHRMARFEEKPQDLTPALTGQDIFPRRFVRHHILNTFTSLASSEDAQTLRGSDGVSRLETGVRAFDTFIDAIDQSMRNPKDAGLTGTSDTLLTGRRLYTVAAYRGLGKGSFVSAFSSKLGLASYLDAAWPAEHCEPTRPFFLAASFLNLSFATEIASLYDMLLDTLFQSVITLRVVNSGKVPGTRRDVLEACQGALDHSRGKTATYIGIVRGQENLFPGGKPRIRGAKALSDAADELKTDVTHLARGHALMRLMHLFGKESELFASKELGDCTLQGRQPRIFVLVQSAELLFYPGGLSKNREIDHLLRHLIAQDKGADLPLDLVLVADENRLGQPWRTGNRKSALLAAKEVMRETPDPEIDPTIRAWHLPPAHFIAGRELGVDGKSVIEKRKLNSGMADLDTAADPDVEEVAHHQVHFARQMRPEQLLIDNFRFLAALLFVLQIDTRAREENKDIEKVVQDLATTLHGAQKTYLSALKAAWEGDIPPDPRPLTEPPVTDSTRLAELVKARTDALDTALTKFAEDVSAEIPALADALRITPHRDVTDMLRQRYETIDLDASREWEEIRRTLRNNRFSFTILLAAAENDLFDALENNSDLIRAAQEAERLIRAIATQVNSVGSDQRELLVVREVLDRGVANSVVGEPEKDHTLQMLLVRHLAVIGTGVSCNVLVRAPQVRDYFDKVNKTSVLSRRRQVARALYALCDRGLVFRLSPHPRLQTLDKDESWPAKLEFRYALHRSLQSLVITNLGGRAAEAQAVNSYAPSLYASMPSELPRLRPDGYAFLYQLVQTMAQYPDQPHRDRVAAPIVFNEQDTSTQVQALRAALSTVRTAFSISIVSRLEQDLEVAGDRFEEVGFFELYKRNLRWVIRKAWELMKVQGNGNDNFKSRRLPPERLFPELNALYRDEIVWLYNEVGLTCLVQGNLHDAVGLFRQAIHLNRGIEGGADGEPQHNRVSLNLAVCQIERGRLDAAATRLDRIATSERANFSTERIFALARCYKGLVCHLMGDRKTARRHYEYAEECLRALEDRRGTAITLYHHANLLRDMDKNRDGVRKMREAIGFAEAGGHEDVRKRLLLTDCFHRLFVPDRAERLRDTEALRRLRSIEDYARSAGCMNLMTDALIIRGQVLIEQDETASAGRLLTSAAGLAKRYSMRLRLNRVMTLYARLLYKRERPEAALDLAKSSLVMAKKSSYRLEMHRIQELLDEIEAQTPSSA